MRSWTATGVVLAVILLGIAIALIACRASSAPARGSQTFGEYEQAFRWQPDGFLYVQRWNELTGTNELAAFDESGDVRTMYSDGRDRFYTGAHAGRRSPVESHVEFRRDASGAIAGLTWRRGNEPPRSASRADTERHEDVRFGSGSLQLAGTLIAPNTSARRHPAVI